LIDPDNSVFVSFLYTKIENFSIIKIIKSQIGDTKAFKSKETLNFRFIRTCPFLIESLESVLAQILNHKEGAE